MNTSNNKANKYNIMKKIEFLAASLPYGLKLQFKEREEEYCRKQVIGTLGGIYSDGIIDCFDTVNSTPTKFKPIIRPLDSLTKECVQSDYNEGNPFVPIVELNKLFDYKDVEIVYYINNGLGWRIGGCFANTAVITDMMLIPICQMLKWHFWPNMPEGEEVVYVTDEFNPYK